MSTILKPLYSGSAALVSTALQSLASSGNLLGAWSSAVVDNTSNLSDDEVITWTIKAGTSPSNGAIAECWLWEILDDTPTYPDTITGSEGTFSWTSLNVKQAGAFKFAGQFVFDATSSRLYSNSCRLSQVFGLAIPKKWGAIFVQSSTVALASSGNVVTRLPMQYQLV